MEKALYRIMMVICLLCIGATYCCADEDAVVPPTSGPENADFLGFRFGMIKSDFLKMCISADGTLSAREVPLTNIGVSYWPKSYFRDDKLFIKSLFGGGDSSDIWENKEYDEAADGFLPQLLELDQLEIVNVDAYSQKASSLGIKPPPMNNTKIQVVFWKNRLLAIRFAPDDQGDLTQAIKEKYGCAKRGNDHMRELLYLCVNSDGTIKLAGKPGDFCYSYDPDRHDATGVAYRPLLKEAIDDASKVWKEARKQQKDQEKQKENQLLDGI